MENNLLNFFYYSYEGRGGDGKGGICDGRKGNDRSPFNKYEN